MPTYVALVAYRNYLTLPPRVTTLEGQINAQTGAITTTLTYGGVTLFFPTYADLQAGFATYAVLTAGVYAASAAQIQGISDKMTQWASNSAAYDSRTNLHPNPSAEVDLTGYSGEGGSAIARVTSDYLYGNASVQITAGTTANANNLVTTNASGFRIPVSPSTQYTVSMYLKVVSGATVNYRVRAVEYAVNSGGTVVVQSAGTATSIAAGAGWTRISFTLTTNAGTSFLVVKPECSNTPSGQVILLDGVLVEKTGTLGTYFDGTYSVPSDYGLPVWLGTSGLSSSRIDLSAARSNTAAQASLTAAQASAASATATYNAIDVGTLAINSFAVI